MQEHYHGQEEIFIQGIFSDAADRARVNALTPYIRIELFLAMRQFPKFNSAHEGIAVLREEYLELEKEIFKKGKEERRIFIEALQCAAMAIRIITDTVPEHAWQDPMRSRRWQETIFRINQAIREPGDEGEENA